MFSRRVLVNLTRCTSLDNPRNYYMANWKRGYFKPAIKRIPKRNSVQDLARLDRFEQMMEIDNYGVTLREKSECVKCFYPLKCDDIKLPSGIAYKFSQLEVLGKGFLQFCLVESFLHVFKRSSTDIEQHDFNFDVKMRHLGASRRIPRKLLQRYVKGNFSRLARLSQPQASIPLRIHRVYDRKCFNALFGYLTLTNESQTVWNLVKGKISRSILKNTFNI
ncbi:LAMI_0A02212g1_1 [Lachancea mirantina]|uniref:LAMI_0A02212g1_1 n=1 Tax=Lachancea mirantina TaxID=1230905 RepID=A0A1G4IMD8_9SACH|nr:LAMI_0A02212g1_1 [Lachancea mirantina]